MTQILIPVQSLLVAVVLLCGASNVSAVILEDFPFSDVNSTPLDGAENVAHVGNNFFLGTISWDPSTTLNGSYRITKTTYRTVHRFHRYRQRDHRQSVACRRAQRMELHCTPRSTSEEVRFAFLDNDPPAVGSSTVTAQMDIRRSAYGDSSLLERRSIGNRRDERRGLVRIAARANVRRSRWCWSSTRVSINTRSTTRTTRLRMQLLGSGRAWHEHAQSGRPRWQFHSVRRYRSIQRHRRVCRHQSHLSDRHIADWLGDTCRAQIGSQIKRHALHHERDVECNHLRFVSHCQRYRMHSISPAGTA